MTGNKQGIIMQDCLAVAPQMIMSLVYSEWDISEKGKAGEGIAERGGKKVE